MSEAAPEKPLHILHLEGDMRDRALVAAHLRDGGLSCEFVHAATEPEFREALERAPPDLILSEFILPSFSGTEALKMARASRPEMPFLFVSGAAGDDWAAEALKSGAVDHVSKHDLRRLPAAVRRAVRESAAIAQRRRAEEALRDSEARFRAFVDHATDAFFLHDIGGAILDLNAQACLSLGYAREELIGRHLAEFDVQADAAFVEQLGRRLEAGEVVAFETRQRRKDGTEFPVEVRVRRYSENGREFGVSLIRDLSAREHAEATLRLRDRAMQAVSQGIAITDAARAGNPLVYVSPGFERMTGYGRDEVLGRNPRLLQGANTDTAAVAVLREALLAGRPCTVELLNYRKDGSPFWNAVSLTPLHEGGRLTHWVSVNTDVTRVRELEEQFWQAQKMEAVGRLAGGVAHDFNNLLTVINTSCRLILDGLRGDHPGRELVLEIQQTGERAANMTRQLLAFSRKQALQPRVVSLENLLKGLFRLLQTLLGANIELALALDAPAPVARVDPGQFEQAIVNLAANARDAMPDGGRLRIATRNVEIGPADVDRHAGLPPGDYVVVSVRDSGSGMDEATRVRIFEPFFTTKEPGKGTGLGLAMVYGFVKQSGGHIEVESEPGRGTTFEVFLPRAVEAPGAPAPGEEPMPVCGGSETILLVEDDPGVRALSRLALRSHGYVVLEARDGEEAIEVARQFPGPIDLLITDLTMPRLNGPQLAGRLKQARPHLRMLIMSGNLEDEALRRLGGGAELAFLPKPFTAADLALKVREVLDAGGGESRGGWRFRD